mmetsp:Transcript_4221/g.13130  ORF Transcript_4221/g.13130 Transcript_4221/m.13130 type:complete len:353 (+) Transcript_4221:93-1151(+)
MGKNNGAVVRTKLTELLGCTHPVMAAPMCGMCKGELAGEVARAGGVGVIGIGAANVFGPDFVRQEFALAKELCSQGEGVKGAVGLGFLSFFLKDDDPSFEAALDCAPDLIVTAFGESSSVIAKCKARGITVAVQVQTTKEAKAARERGADCVIVQGCDAGGHGMQHSAVSLVTLIPQLRKDLGPDACLVAAGGIGSGVGVAAALTLGADAVLLGTRYLATQECAAKDAYKDRLLATRDGTASTVVTQAFDWFAALAFPDPWSGRALVPSDPKLLADFHVPPDTPADRRPLVTDDDKLWYKNSGYDVRAVWCGAGVGLHPTSDAAERAFDVTVDIIHDAADHLRNPRRATLLP